MPRPIYFLVSVNRSGTKLLRLLASFCSRARAARFDRHQLGQSTHRNPGQRASRRTRHLLIPPRGNSRKPQDRHRRRDTPHSQGSEGKREESTCIRQRRQDTVGMTSPRGIYLVPNREGTITTMAPQDRESGGPILPMWSGGSIWRVHRLAVQATPGRTKTEPHRKNKGLGEPRRQDMGPRRRARRRG